VGAIQVVRFSGPKSCEILRALSPKIRLQHRGAELVEIEDLIAKRPLDEALSLFFKGPNSYTGEDVCEVSLHGSPFVLKRFLENALKLGARLARPGEFTERAYLNGKLDLAQAEAVADLIHAETEIQAKLAKEQLSGRLSEVISKLGDPLRDLLAEIEAHIDFPEEDITPLAASEWSKRIDEIQGEIARYISTFRQGKLSREGAAVVLIGLPNAGKSSLLNALVGEDRAIVTPIAGTTRDSIEEHITLDGLLIRVWDTAGLAGEGLGLHTPDEVEKLGIERSWKRAENADLILYLTELSESEEVEKNLLQRIRGLGPKVLVLRTKSDLNRTPIVSADVEISTKSGDGIATLKNKIVETLLGSRSESLLITTERHRRLLEDTKDELAGTLKAIRAEAPAEFISVHLRSALTSLEEIIGVTTNDDILGLIFSKFCIGK